jgi:hypothetical protein
MLNNEEVSYLIRNLEGNSGLDGNTIERLLEKLYKTTFRLHKKDKDLLRIHCVECRDDQPQDLYDKLDY